MARKSKQDWLRAGLNVLVAHGPDGLNVETLTGHLAVSKGSFYHHFVGLPEYRSQLLAHLEQIGFADVVAQVDDDLPAFEQLDRLTNEISRLDLSGDRAVRLWAERDVEARALIERLDARRLAYLTNLFTEVLGDRAEGQAFARMGYALFLGAGQMRPPLEGEEYRQMTQRLSQLLPQTGDKNHAD